MYFLFVPFLYSTHTRLISFSSKIAWFFTYFFPVLIVGKYFDFSLLFIIILVLCIYSAYELGYIFNDCELIKKENKPTLRLSENELFFYENNKYFIYGVRAGQLLFLNFIVFIFFGEYFFSLTLVIFLILAIYCIYNSIRNNFNIPLYSFLIFLRYFLFFIIFFKSIELFLFLFLVYPLCVTIEFSSKERFSTSNVIKINNFDQFRVFYYIFLCLIALMLYLFTTFNFIDLFLFLAFYFFVYRLLSYLFLAKWVRGKV